jgi:hypothetical protein
MTRITGESQPPGQGRAGAALLAASVAGVALAPLALRRLGRGGSLLVAAGCGALFVRDAQMTLTGAPARLRPLPRLLLRTEVPVSGSAAGATLLACWQHRRPGVARVAAIAGRSRLLPTRSSRYSDTPWPVTATDNGPADERAAQRRLPQPTPVAWATTGVTLVPYARISVGLPSSSTSIWVDRYRVTCSLVAGIVP